ncbi:gliding motility-associated C-terminal domain-containing protein [bacterium SCSIO 12741]|nr:gliding motility-associated C-terminal domain-containing protein [bacterium SCSIO 12741]
MKKFGYIILLLAALSSCWPGISYAHDHEGDLHSYSFVENRNQWPDQIHYRVEIPSGKLYLEKNRLFFHFSDWSQLHSWHIGEAEFENDNVVINHHSYEVEFVGANPEAKVKGNFPSISYYNFFLGDDPDQWVSDVPAYQEVIYEDLYPGIDLKIYSKEDQLKYEFIVDPMADPSQIQLRYKGQDQLKIKDGQLEIHTSLAEIREDRPVLFLKKQEELTQIPGSYLLRKNTVSFRVDGSYNGHDTLIIDPTMIFSTYSGSTSPNFGYTATFDSEGFLYSGSTVFGNGYDTTLGAFQTTFAGGFGPGGTDIAITKYDTTGGFMVYSTYLGGTGDEQPHSIVVNSRDQLYMLGTSGSLDFPTATNGLQRQLKVPNVLNNVTLGGMGIRFDQGCDMVVVKFSNDGKFMLGGTYIGGSSNDGLNDYDLGTPVVRRLKYNYADEVRGEIDIDRDDNVYIASTTMSNDFPIVGNTVFTSYQFGKQDGIIVKLKNDLSGIIWSSYWGGIGLDAIYSLAIDRNNNIVVAGGTTSPNFPAGSHPRYRSQQGGRCDGFISHIKSDGTAIINSTYYGTRQYDQVYFVDLDKDENIFVYGQTEDSTNHFIRHAAYNTPRSGQFVTKFGPQLDTIHWSTTFGTATGVGQLASPNISPTAFLVDLCSSIYLSGWGGATNQSPIVTNNAGHTGGMDTLGIVPGNLVSGTTDSSDFYLMVLKDDASQLVFGAFIGGSAAEHVDGGTSRFDKKGKIYQSVCAACVNTTVQFPTTPGAHARNSGSASCNNAVFKMDFLPPTVVSEFQIPAELCINDSVQAINLSKEQKSSTYKWFFGKDSSTQKEPFITFDSTGTFKVTLIIIDSTSCNIVDSLTKNVSVRAANLSFFPNDSLCLGDTIDIGGNFDPSLTYSWIPNHRLTNPNSMLTGAYPTQTTNYRMLVSGPNQLCTDTFQITLQVDSAVEALFSLPDSVCEPFQVTAMNQSTLLSTSTWIWDITQLGTTTVANPQLQISKKGVYQFELRVSDSLSCNKHDTLIREVIAESDTTFPLFPQLACNRVGVEIGIPDTSGYTYRWTSGYELSDSTVSQPIANPATDTTYFLLIDKGICTDTAVQEVFIDSILLATDGDTNVCLTNSQSVEIGATGFGTSSKFHWSSDTLFSDTLTALTDSTLLVTPSGFVSTYYVRATSSRGCSRADSVIVRINDFGIRTSNDASICLGDSVWMNVISDVPGDTLFARWTPFEEMHTSNDSTSVLVTPSEDRWYQVEVENRIKCLIVDSVFIEVSELDTLQADATTNRDTILKNQFAQLDVTPKGFAYRWEPETGLSNTTAADPQASPQETTTYEVTVFDPNKPECEVKRSVLIQVDEIVCGTPFIYLPNSFTPNEDGKNDKLYLRGKYVDHMELYIYNRWGEKVFQSNEQSEGWDGQYKDAPAPGDVYSYYLYVRCVDNQEYETKGDITLIR